MGYVRAHLKLEFEDPELAGFVVTTAARTDKD